MNKANQFGILLSVLTVTCTVLFTQTTIEAAVIGPGDVGPPAGIAPGILEFLEFSNYVESCKAELGIESIPQFDCRDIKFRDSDPRTFSVGSFARTNDFVAHQQIDNSTSAVFACRWVGTDPATGQPNAATGEMIVHNKYNGKTCFFQLKDIATHAAGARVIVPQIQTTNPPSPTDSSAHNFWETPTKVAATACTGCHSAGPWIASSPIVGALAQYGLINDGHDIKGEMYSAVGSIGPEMDSIAKQTLQSAPCSSSCHVLGGVTPNGTRYGKTISDGAGNIIIPSIQIAISELLGTANDGFDQLPISQRMPPNDRHSEFRWVNLDNPGGAGGDWERLKDLKAKHPEFMCNNGVTEVQMHVVDSGRRLSTFDLPNVLRTFNLIDGLVCSNADQPDGSTCADYQTRYHCSSGWTKWRNLSSVDGNGDDESRANFPGLCSEPTEIQARTTIGGIDTRGSVTFTGFGPPDRLQSFDVTHGVACRNSSQPSGQCHDYTVRYVCKQ